MKTFLIICSGLMFLATASLPIGYYTLLRIIISIGGIVVIVNEYKGEINFWLVSFVLIIIIFNPIVPIYFNDKSSWIPFNIIGGILFLVKSFNINTNNYSKKQ